MAYVKGVWVDDVSPLSAARLNNLETQYDEAKTYADATFQKTTKVYGNVSYTDTIAFGETLTKNIALGAAYAHGKMTVMQTGTSGCSVLVHFGTDYLKTKVCGEANEHSGAWTRRERGWITWYPTAGITYGNGCCGDFYLSIADAYISGTNLVIVFLNQEGSGSRNLSCTVDWEVW